MKIRKVESEKCLHAIEMDKKEILEKIKVAETSKSLSIHDVKFTVGIWNEIIKLTNLESLYIRDSFIDDLPGAISELVNLKQLDMYNCRIFGKYLNIEDIFFEDIPLKKESPLFPVAISLLISLESLKLEWTIFENYTGIGKLVNLKYLDLSNCQLSSLPTEILTLKNLESINLSNNQFKEFPKDIFKFINLKALNFGYNQITEIPKEISKFKNIEQIYLWHNQIINVPLELFNLKKLLVLRLNENKITTLPIEISNIKSFADINIEDNPLNATIFGYTFLDKNQDVTRFINWEKDLFNLVENYALEIREDYYYFKEKHNHVCIEYVSYRNGNNKSYYHQYFDCGFLIYIFGENETQKVILTELRKKIDFWVKNELNKNLLKIFNEEKTPFRFFVYPITENREKEAIIDFDKLLKYKVADENIYFDDKLGIKIPVIDLLKYIGAENEKIDRDWKGTNHITNIKIQDFKVFKEIEINLSENINIILGNNGLGKTSILQAITFGALPRENIYEIGNFIDFISFNSEKSEIKINWGENENRKLFIFQKGRPDIVEPVNPPHPLLLSYGVNLNTNNEQNHDKIVAQLISGNGELYFTKSIFEDNYNRMFDPIIVLQDLLREFDITKKPEIKKIIDIYFNTLNDFLDLIEGDEKIKIEKKKIDYFYTDLNGNKLKTNNLSEGYRDHVMLVSDILIRIIAGRKALFENTETQISNLFKEAKGVILIDEFDRHLHPIWQRKLLSKFKEDFPNIQFVLTTHNPFSVQSAVGGNAIQLKIENGKIIDQNSIIESKNILSIIQEYFTEDFFDFETQNLLKQLSEYLDKISEGKIELTYSKEFKNVVQQLYDRGDELQSIIASQLLQLNSRLKKMNKKEFVL